MTSSRCGSESVRRDVGNQLRNWDSQWRRRVGPEAPTLLVVPFNGYDGKQNWPSRCYV
jgi:hypothetical protein